MKSLLQKSSIQSPYAFQFHNNRLAQTLNACSYLLFGTEGFCCSKLCHFKSMKDFNCCSIIYINWAIGKKIPKCLLCNNNIIMKGIQPVIRNLYFLLFLLLLEWVIRACASLFNLFIFSYNSSTGHFLCFNRTIK